MTAPNAVLAYKILDHIDAHPEQWDQGTWLRKGECGTIGCFAGWAVMLADLDVEFYNYTRDDGSFSYRDVTDWNGHRTSVEEAACQVLGIEDGLFDEGDLFGGYNTREDLGRLVAEIFGPRPAGAE